MTSLADKFELDLTSCDREPIHIPGSIQPHGYLLAIDESGMVTHISQNVPDLLGISAVEVLDRPILATLAVEGADIPDEVTFNSRTFDVSVRPSGALRIVELEPKAEMDLTQVIDSLRGFDEPETVRELAEKLTEVVRRLCGFDRVMVYRFLPDDTGVVIAEDVRDDQEPYLGLHYPATDIPKQARQLYLLNKTRLVADVGYKPIPILASGNSESAKAPLDLSYSALRSVSPIHVQYLKNMGVVSSMSISLTRAGRLWGLIACHHLSPWYGSKKMRETCELIGEIASVHVGALEDRQDASHLRRGQEMLQSISAKMTDDSDFFYGLLQSESELLDLVRATGAAIIRDGKCHLLGATPSTTEIMRLIQWVSAKSGRNIYKTESLADEVPEARRYATVASGLMAVSLTSIGEDHVVWFRPEVVETITWAGNPDKPMDEGNQLHPRSSFDLWKQQVRQRSQPWLPAEETLVHQLRVAILEAELKSMNSQLEARVAVRTAELQKAVDELNGFTYSVSHDLRTPLRGMVGNSRIILEEYGDKLVPGVKDKLRQIERNALRMANLVDDLLSFARLGRQDLKKISVNVSELARRCATRLIQQGWPCTGLDVSVQEGMFAVADPAQIEILLTILIENGCKYRLESQCPKVWITAEEQSGHWVYMVSNIGIGFDNQYADRMFKPFERLHRDNEYPGTGIGLANAKRIVERHGGTIWGEGRPGEGATFCFTL